MFIPVPLMRLTMTSLSCTFTVTSPVNDSTAVTLTVIGVPSSTLSMTIAKLGSTLTTGSALTVNVAFLTLAVNNSVSSKVATAV